MSDFEKDLENLINKHSKENASNTPDFLLAEYLSSCLINYNNVVSKRDKWLGVNQSTESPEVLCG